MASIKKFEDLICWQRTRELANFVKAEFIDALFIAKGETGEVRSQLFISFDRKYITKGDLEKGLKLVDECSRLIQSFASKVKGSARAGLQFKVAEKPDVLKEIIKEHSPELYKKFYEKK